MYSLDLEEEIMFVGWPQGIMIALLMFNIIYVGIKHGQTKTEKYNFGVTLIAVIFQILLLWWGGFFA